MFGDREPPAANLEAIKVIAQMSKGEHSLSPAIKLSRAIALSLFNLIFLYTALFIYVRLLSSI